MRKRYFRWEIGRDWERRGRKKGRTVQSTVSAIKDWGGGGEGKDGWCGEARSIKIGRIDRWIEDRSFGDARLDAPIVSQSYRGWLTGFEVRIMRERERESRNEIYIYIEWDIYYRWLRERMWSNELVVINYCCRCCCYSCSCSCCSCSRRRIRRRRKRSLPSPVRIRYT